MELFAVSKRFISIVKSLETKGLVKSKSQLAEKLGTHKQSLNEILNGKRNVTVELATKICEHFYANPAFLLMGHSPLFINPDAELKRNITYVPVKALAGYGEQLDNPVFEDELEKFAIPGNHFNDNDYRCFEVEGQSMEPNYYSGDKVICSAIAPVYFAQALREQAAYIVVTKKSIFLKRLINKINTASCITLVSDNPDYEPFDLSIKDVSEIWKVEGYISKRVGKQS
jgi:phage repressor protein C with HTH and peptisase S24 domain